MEGERKFLMRDKRSESHNSIKEMQEKKSQLVEQAQEQLDVIGSSLKDFIERIASEKPDAVVFLDKGARVLAVPMRKYLKDNFGSNFAKVSLYNDDRIKTPFLRNESIEEVAKTDFAPFAGKKVFFVDETFSSGKGAVTLEKAAQIAGVDMRYFALSRESNGQVDLSEKAPFEPGKFYGLSLEEYEKELERIKNDPRFTIYPNNIKRLFTKDAAGLYVVDSEGKTESRYELVPEEEEETIHDYSSKKQGEIPSARRYEQPPDNLSWEEYDKKVREANWQTIRTLQHMILETLEKSAEQSPDRAG
jgi:orotate phosphoribosyltransferase-like protein